MSALLTACAVLAGCGGGGDDQSDSGQEPLTARAVAAVMLDHLPHDTSSREATYVDEHSAEALVGADLRYGSGPGEDGDLVRVTVSRESPDECDPDDHCADLGDGVRLRWDEVAPEEDPGIVLVERQDGDELVTALVAGPEITGDPRELDIEPSVATLTDLVRDPRLRLRTDPTTVADGAALEEWGGGEVDPADLEAVPNNDATVVVGWIWAYGEDWTYVGPSPLKKVFGEEAIGGRVRVAAELGPMTDGYLDALAAPQPPAWLEDGCLEDYRCETRRGLHLVWRPANGSDPGDAYVIHVRPGGETVAFHSVGNRLGTRWPGAAGASGLFFWGPDLTDADSEQAISLTTTREKLEQAEERAERGR